MSLKTILLTNKKADISYKPRLSFSDRKSIYCISPLSKKSKKLLIKT